MYVCLCYAVTDDDLALEIADGARTAHDVADRCGAGTGCGSCVDRICSVLERSTEPVGAAGKIAPAPRRDRMPLTVQVTTV